MRKLFSTRYNAGAFNTGLFLLRAGVGILMAHHGYDKMEHFDMYKTHMMNFLGLSQQITLCLLIFSELFCAILVVLGLFTRFACIVLIISCTVGLMKGHQWDVFGMGEAITLYLISFLTLLFTGPGKASVDNLISK